MTKPETVYQQRIEHLELRLGSFENAHTAMGFIKLILIVAGLLVLFKTARDFSWGFFWVLCGFLLAFLAAALVHGRLLRKRNGLDVLRRIAEDELGAVQGKWLEFDSGKEFFEEDHPYDLDMDLFGPRSLFHYLNRTSTHVGRATLAGWLKRPPSENLKTVISVRQRAVEELAGKMDFRHSILAEGRSIADSSRTVQAFQDLFHESYLVHGKEALIWFLRLWPALTVGSVAFIVLKISWIPLLVGMGIQMILNKFMGKKIVRVFHSSARHWRILNAYGKILGVIERTGFSCEGLTGLQEGLRVDSRTASSHIKKLSTLLGYFEMRSSHIFHFIINNVIFWDLHCIHWIERWRHRVGPEMARWFEVIGQAEALSSLATLKFNNPDWVQPQIESGSTVFEAEDLGHPLIPREERVSNALKLQSEAAIAMVTGPNMAGKTTFLKAVGVNIILAGAGAAVCAGRFKMAPLNLYTSMKVSDSLDKHLSLFYAELRRLKMILEAIDRREPVFFLIDEMLKGTNEVDRHQGAKALIRQLVRSRVPGLIATHDLKLTDLEGEFPGRILNFHFDGFVRDGRLLFDYSLKPGVCRSSNALELMEGIGIRIDAE